VTDGRTDKHHDH